MGHGSESDREIPCPCAVAREPWPSRRGLRPFSQPWVTRHACGLSPASAMNDRCPSPGSPRGSRVTRQAITKPLHVMEEVGLVRSTRHGRESIWQLDQRRLKDARHYLDLISKQWDDALARLREFVED